MKIFENSIHNFSANFDSLEQEISGCNYVVCFEGFTFKYENDANFTLNDLQKLCSTFLSPNKKIDGEIELSSYEILKTITQKALLFVSYSATLGLNLTQEQLFLREKTYWNIVNKFFPYTESTIYRHHPYLNSYFGNYVMWEFTFILLHKGNGVVISGQSWD